MNISTDFFDYFKQDNIQMCYSGPFDSLILSVLANNIENNTNANQIVVKKLYKIFIELTQNVALYSYERIKYETNNTSVGFGSVMVRESDDYLVIIVGNITSKQDIEPIIERCNTINSLTHEDLREYKRKQRKAPNNKLGSGNIGLIQVALIAENALDFKTVNLNEDEYFYLVSVKINKISTEK